MIEHKLRGEIDSNDRQIGEILYIQPHCGYSYTVVCMYVHVHKLSWDHSER